MIYISKHYSYNLKEKALHEILHNNKKVSEVAQELNLVPQTLYRWLQTYRENSTVAASSHSIELNQKYITKLETENAILKKSRLINNHTESIFKFIHDHKGEFAVSTMCDLLDVSSSGYYKWLKSVPSNEERRHNSLKQAIETLYITHGPNVSSAALTNLILEQNLVVSQSTVARILRDNKQNWHRRYSKFHRDDLIALDFPTKDDVWCSNTNSFYDINHDTETINHMLNSHSFVQLMKHDAEGVHDVSDFKNSDNLIIKGDNLIALHHLKSRFKSQVQLVYFDPPYNNENYTTSYPNAYSQSTYLTFIKNRLDAVKPLLKASGTIFIQCNNQNQAYIKILCDQTFGKNNFVNQVIWRRSQSQQNRAHVASVVDYILIYAKDIDKVQMNKLPLSDADKSIYNRQDEKGLYRIDRLSDNKNGYYHYSITTPNSKVINGAWNCPKSTFHHLLNNNEIFWSNSNYPYKKVYLHKIKGKVPSDLWIDPDQFGSNQQASREVKQLFGKDKFTYPKPELLMYRILQLATNEGDIVLDPFLGSATTATVAHKMHRQYIGIEKLDYIEDISLERIKKVISGDKGGISSKVNWNDGGSFIYAELK